MRWDGTSFDYNPFMDAKSYSVREEIAHSATHGLGIVLSLAGLVALVTTASRTGDLDVVASAVYGVTLVLLYLTSTLYHSIPHPPAKRVLRILDHSAIYLLIAGTYTPFTLVLLRGPWGWTPLGDGLGAGRPGDHAQGGRHGALPGGCRWCSTSAWAGWW